MCAPRPCPNTRQDVEPFCYKMYRINGLERERKKKKNKKKENVWNPAIQKLDGFTYAASRFKCVGERFCTRKPDAPEELPTPVPRDDAPRPKSLPQIGKKSRGSTKMKRMWPRSFPGTFNHGQKTKDCPRLTVRNRERLLVPLVRSGLSLERCRFGSACWRPLCPYVHAHQRARRWAELWNLLADQEEDAPVMQIIPQQSITEKKAVEQAEQTVDISALQNHDEVVDFV